MYTLTCVVISYKTYETSLRQVPLISYERTTTSVGFFLSYDPLKWKFVAYKMSIISIRKRCVDMDVVIDEAYTRQIVSRFGMT